MRRPRMLGGEAIVLVVVVSMALVAGCGSGDRDDPVGRPRPSTVGTAHDDPPAPESAGGPALLPGMPPPLDPGDVYAADRPGMLSAAVRGDPALVYVPNSQSNTVDAIDQRTYRIIRQFPTGAEPQHVTPSWDLRRLWVGNDQGNSLTPINPRTGKPGRRVRVFDPYNLYFTPDGRSAVVVAERLGRLDFRDPHTMALRHALTVPCKGVDHMDFSANGRYAIVSCEFSGQLLKVGIDGDAKGERVLGSLRLRGRSPMPQDVKLSPDGRVFYVADMAAGGVWLVDGDAFKVIGFVATGRGAHGLYASRDSRTLYVSNRAATRSATPGSFADGWRATPGHPRDHGAVVPAAGRLLQLPWRPAHADQTGGHPPPTAPTGTAARAGGGPICGRLAKPPATLGHAADPSTTSMRTAFNL